MSIKTCTKLICWQWANKKDGENMKKTMTIILCNCSNGLSSLNSYFGHEQYINFDNGSPVYLTR